MQEAGQGTRARIQLVSLRLAQFGEFVDIAAAWWRLASALDGQLKIVRRASDTSSAAEFAPTGTWSVASKPRPGIDASARSRPRRLGSVAPAHMIHSRATGRNLLARGPLGQGGQDSEKPRMGRIEVDLLIAGTGGSIYFQGNPATPSRLW